MEIRVGENEWKAQLNVGSVNVLVQVSLLTQESVSITKSPA